MVLVLNLTIGFESEKWLVIYTITSCTEDLSLLGSKSKMKWLVKIDIFYSGVLGLRLGVCSPEQPLVPTGVKSPSSVSVKRGLHSSIFTNQWKHFLSPCPPHSLRMYQLQQIDVIHSRVSWLLVNMQLGERFSGLVLRGEVLPVRVESSFYESSFFMLYRNPWSWLWSNISCVGINAQGLPLKPSTVQLWGVNTPKGHICLEV